MKEYKVLAPQTNVSLEENLNAFAKEGWKPILMSATQAHAEGPAAITVILEMSKRKKRRS